MPSGADIQTLLEAQKRMQERRPPPAQPPAPTEDDGYFETTRQTICFKRQVSAQPDKPIAFHYLIEDGSSYQTSLLEAPYRLTRGLDIVDADGALHLIMGGGDILTLLYGATAIGDLLMMPTQGKLTPGRNDATLWVLIVGVGLANIHIPGRETLPRVKIEEGFSWSDNDQIHKRALVDIKAFMLSLNRRIILDFETRL